MTDDPADNLLMISALQHYAFCPRQCALIHVEQTWAESGRTAEGRIMHEHVHDEGRESRNDIRIERGVPLRSLRLGLIGKADVVEFHRQVDGSWLPFPVEYKRGKPKADDCDKVQLCAQAICLEEMLDAAIPEGALFYGQTRRRLDVVFDEALRRKTEETARCAQELIASGRTPPPVYAKRCESCSLMAECLPKTIQKRRSVKGYLARVLGSEES
ncbi:MAG: CRISPR-associated protein Cas4/endonuclease Cas1 fusion [Syntrophaceae bacterium PtaU1.Bin231]|nr:MAG: CRISPR-associated protein Cas4/endonuclease Cas1 fusion [Syntrophaceae bacterium PtaU1.Bin231]HOG17890.1 CRISPR-associated protein Cas4 [Syntrophales bacterium]